MKKITFTILTLFLIFSCEKENDSIFSGVTELDYYGERIGRVDESDWRFDDVWNDKEEMLFDHSYLKTTKYNNILNFDPSPVQILGSKCSAYPNPAKQSLILKFESNADSIKVALVNNNYDIILSSKSIGGNPAWSFDVSDRVTLKANTLYRIYYKLYYTDNEAERGHGDIKLIN
jgi:hypothetical protein